MKNKKSKKNKKEAIAIFEQILNPSDILIYVPDSLKRKLTPKEKNQIKNAFHSTILTYKKKYDENYLDRMVI